MPNYLKVSTKTKKSKWSKVKSKTVVYFKKISISGISRIVITESYLIKILWTVVIICVFGVGFDNISEAVTDYYKFDKITNIERVYPENVTFPAITICNPGGYNRRHYRNGSLIKSERVYNNLLKQFVNFRFTFFLSLENNDSLRINVSNHFDVFKINHPRGYSPDCLRFNAVTNKALNFSKRVQFYMVLELVSITSTEKILLLLNIITIVFHLLIFMFMLVIILWTRLKTFNT
jgi:hypothetical protein